MLMLTYINVHTAFRTRFLHMLPIKIVNTPNMTVHVDTSKHIYNIHIMCETAYTHKIQNSLCLHLQETCG